PTRRSSALIAAQPGNGLEEREIVLGDHLAHEQIVNLLGSERRRFGLMAEGHATAGIEAPGSDRVVVVDERLAINPDGHRQNEDIVFLDEGVRQLACRIHDQTYAHPTLPGDCRCWIPSIDFCCCLVFCFKAETASRSS